MMILNINHNSTRREESVIPNTDFITSLLNITPSDIASSNIRTDDDIVYYEITLVRKPLSCPLCGGQIYNSRFRMKLNKRDLFNMILNSFPVLAKTYDLNEEYRKFNRESTYDDACEKLMEISKKFKNSGIRQFDEFTAILFHWQEEILNSFRRPYGDRKLSNSFTENVNGRIRTYLTVSNGVNNFQRFRKRVIFSLSPDVYYTLTSTLDSEKREGKKRSPYNKSTD